MLSMQFVRNGQSRITTRWFTCSSIARESNQAPKNSNTVREDVIGTRMHNVTTFDKLVLTWVKRYPSFAEVPKKVTADCLLNARSKARIKVTNYLMVASIFGFITFAIMGKRQFERGETVTKMRQDWYNEMQEKDKNK